MKLTELVGEKNAKYSSKMKLRVSGKYQEGGEQGDTQAFHEAVTTQL
jgi:hypothetical protein